MNLFAFPFRIFFIGSAASAALLVPLWLMFWRYGGIDLMVLPPLLWHPHEMLAGFLNAAIAGFILTAVCNWTGTPPVAGRALVALFSVWLLARVLMLVGASVASLAVLVDLAFLPIVAAVVALRVTRARQPRQIPLVLVLLALWGMDVAFHVSSSVHYLHVLILLSALLILVVGGRITPAFSANWLRMRGVDPARVYRNLTLDVIGLVLMVVVVLMELFAWRSAISAAIAVAAAAVLATRLVGWRGWLVRAEPLLWILHLGHVWIVVGLLLWALAAVQMVAPTAWLHALGAGAMGTMILGVITRVTMGHTGRPIALQPGMLAGYFMVLVAAALRVASGVGLLSGAVWLWLAAVLWSAAFALFLVQYTPILAAPRADGRPG